MEQKNILTGTAAEIKFIKIIKRIRPTAIITKASIDQDMYEHWDYEINAIKVDVKSIRTCQVDGGTNLTVVEYVNKNNDAGSLYGKADYIAFESGTTTNSVFLLVDRKELIKHCKNNIKMITVDSIFNALNKLYCSNGNDLIAVVNMDILKDLNNSKIIK
jgi:hypothetical protein